MSTSTIPTRSNNQTIDQTWFNILQSALGGDIVARNSSGVATQNGGNLGSSAYAFGALFLVEASGENVINIAVSPDTSESYTITLPPGPADTFVPGLLFMDENGNILLSGDSSIAYIATAGNSSLPFASLNLIPSGRAVKIFLKGAVSGTASFTQGPGTSVFTLTRTPTAGGATVTCEIFTVSNTTTTTVTPSSGSATAASATTINYPPGIISLSDTLYSATPGTQYTYAIYMTGTGGTLTDVIATVMEF